MSEPTEPKEVRKLTGIEWTLLGLGLLVLIAIGAITLLRSRGEAQEGSAIGTLRSLATSQAMWESCAQVDQDCDGIGEYALLGEMAGTTRRRTSVDCTGNAGEQLWGPRANPTFLTPFLGPKGDNPWGTKSGYHFQIFLPGKQQCITDHGPADPILLNYNLKEEAAIINVQETKFRAYAWPVAGRFHATRCFVVDQAAEVLSAGNTKGSGEETVLIYQGESQTPGYSAATPHADKPETPETMESNCQPGLGRDGQTWIKLSN